VTPVGRPLEAAAANWLWLTGTTQTDDAFYAGAADHPLAAILTLQFRRVTAAPASPGERRIAIEALTAESVDYAAFPGVFDWWNDGPRAFATATRRILRRGGTLCVAGTNVLRLPGLRTGESGRPADAARPRGFRVTGAAAVRDAFAADGFLDVRAYRLDPGYEQPYLIVPWTGRAAIACERARGQQLGANRARIRLAEWGLHSLLYGGWLIVARAP
jgi:hypothetical protein